MATLGSTLFSVDKAFQLKTWILVAVSHNELFTDDTYEFSRGMKAVMGAVAELKHLKGKSAGKLAEGEDDTSLLKYLDQSVLDERLLAIVDAISTMRDKYRAGQPWCKGQIEQAFRAITDNRKFFSVALQTRIDEYFATYKQAQSVIGVCRLNDVLMPLTTARQKTDTFKRNAGWQQWAV